jgi:quinol monooxygenase YgiN
MVVSTLRLFPSSEQRRHVLSVFRSVQGPVQALTHCLSSRLFEEDGGDEGILYVEQWDSEPELYQHLRSDLYNRVLAISELSRTQPEFHFYYVKESRGMELIESLRTQKFNGQNEPNHPDS